MLYYQVMVTVHEYSQVEYEHLQVGVKESPAVKRIQRCPNDSDFGWL